MELRPGINFLLDGNSYAYVGATEETGATKLVARIDPLQTESALHRVLDPVDVAARGERFWVTSSERYTPEAFSRQYDEQVQLLRQEGVLKTIKPGFEGITDSSGTTYAVPTKELIFQRMLEKPDVYGPKIEQGFTQLLLVPFAMRLSDLYDAYIQQWEKHFDRKQLFATKHTASEPDTLIQLIGNEVPLAFFKDSDEYSPYESLYYPSGFNNGGKQKKDLLQAGISSGWNILLVQDIPIFFDTQTEKPLRKRLPLALDKSPEEYMVLLKENPDYAHEVGFTYETWFSYALFHMMKRNQLLDRPVDAPDMTFCMLLGNYNYDSEEDQAVPTIFRANVHPQLTMLFYRDFPKMPGAIDGTRTAVQIT